MLKPMHMHVVYDTQSVCIHIKGDSDIMLSECTDYIVSFTIRFFPPFPWVIVWDPNTAINLGEWAICGGGKLQRFHGYTRMMNSRRLIGHYFKTLQTCVTIATTRTQIQTTLVEFPAFYLTHERITSHNPGGEQ